MPSFTSGLPAKLTTPFFLVLAGAMQTLALAPFNYWVLGPISIALIHYATKAIQNDIAPPTAKD